MKQSNNQTILVTGGAGYIGSLTVKQLCDDGYDVVVLDSLENGHREAVDPRAQLEIVDLADLDQTEKVFEKHKIEAVIDFAAYLAVGESMENPEKYIRNNVINFIKLLHCMKKYDVRNIIKSSTASTYGNPKKESDFPLIESYQENYQPSHSALLPGKWKDKELEGEEFFQEIITYYDFFYKSIPDFALSQADITKLRIPTSVYGLTKLLDEIILEKYNRILGINWVALRYFNVCGASLDGKMGEDKPKPTTLMTLAIWSLLDKIDKLQVFGNDYPTKDGTGIRDYVHPLDLATGHISALEYLLDGNKSAVFNLGNGTGYSVFEVIKAVEIASHKKVKYEIKSRRSGDPAISFCDPRKAKNILGWRAKYNLTDMAETAWKWHSKHPEGYNGG